ncbi:hypothetical protein DCO58_09540 [Helicobacter saguini]|uniref:Uncharacterized protein n=1 Tax=Helicobacter saguini TaxID=1548018 RepID=A0A4U8T587_9HELI|nr:hypothetical protein [Helicobacter saguini]MWV67889.1 hypothetical protein [Helicobacter saguini]MWV72547.1 hypothetical protein [Helicobacter saguini]TLD94716.1 hypothetical protein LS64_004125 [Helicobacter saguini]
MSEAKNLIKNKTDSIESKALTPAHHPIKKLDSIESKPPKMRSFEPTRGFGYWTWKPQVILQSLSQIEQNDILIYTDIGCNFLPEFANNLLKKLEILESQSMIAFELEHIAKAYTKADTFAFFDVLDDKSYTNTNLIKAGVIFMKKCEKTQIIMQEWLESMWQDFHIVDDSKSKIKNFPEFKAHRHDQSVFSIIAKKHKVFTLPDYHNACESEFALSDSRDKFSLDMVDSSTYKLLNVLGKIYPVKKVRKNLRKIMRFLKVFAPK